MSIQKTNSTTSLMLSEEEMFNVLGGENNEDIAPPPTIPNDKKPDKSNKCDKCDKCILCI